MSDYGSGVRLIFKMLRKTYSIRCRSHDLTTAQLVTVFFTPQRKFTGPLQNFATNVKLKNNRLQK